MGDRIRMMEHAADLDVFVRSMASRGEPGGLAETTWLAAAALAIRDPRLLGSAIRRLRALASPRRVPQDVEPALRLFDIAVTQDSRGRGLGRRLLDATIAAARERGYPAMGLSVLADNERALRLYGSSGFVPNQRGVRDDGQTYITMRLSLKMSGEPEGSDAGS